MEEVPRSSTGARLIPAASWTAAIADKPGRQWAKVTPSRGHSRHRRKSGLATASRSATFSPETTSRWVRPDARKSLATPASSL